jgi:fermentation-respiration switch protein FrsA (DUF1100 family)
MRKTIHQTVQDTRPWRGGTRSRLTFQGDGEPIPAILLLPPGEGPHPAALLLHGYSSRKEHMADGVGAALLDHGIASLAIDLPLHGSRADPVQAQSARNPLAAVRLWRLAQREAALAVQYLAARSEVNRGCLAVAGYSMGSFLAVMLAASEPLVRAVVLAAGGDLPSGTPLAAVARTVADPLRAVRRLNGRPLLMIHGKNDRTVKPEQARRLFDAAGEPKELRWWSSGHILPAQAVDDAAGWLAERLRRRRRSATG